MRKILSVLIIVSFCSLFLLFRASAAEEFVFQFGKNGYENTKDTHITEYPGNNENNMGGNIENECCEYNPANVDGKSVLIWFDVSSIPKGAILGEATLELYMTKNRNGGNKKGVAAHRLLKDWAEGTGKGIDGNAADVEEVCGKWTGKGEKWAKVGADEPGSDFEEEADDTIEIEGKINEWYSWNITKMCQYWVNNSDKNFGAILLEPRPHAKTTGTKVFASKENPDKKIFPKLTVLVTALPVDSSDKLAISWGAIKLGF